MKKRIASVLLLVFVMLAAIGVLAACNKGDTLSDTPSNAAPEPTPVDYFTFEPNSSRDGYILTGTQKILPANVVIPAEYMGLPVTEIGESAFEGCAEIESVVISEQVKHLRFAAFKGCTQMEKISLASVTETIEVSCFADCTNLLSVTIPSGVHIIEGGAFMGCSSLAEVTIMNGVKRILAGAFAECRALAQIDLPASLEYVSNADLYQNDDTILAFLKENHPIPSENVIGFLKGDPDVDDGFDEIGSFENCTNLTRVSFSSNTYLTASSFRGCDNLTTVTIY